MTERVARLVGLGLLGAVLVTGCAQAPQPRAFPTTPAPSSSGSFDCADHIQSQGVPRSYHAVLGAVALPVWPAGGIQHTARDSSNGAPRLFAKSGLLVHTGVASTITTQAPPSGRALIGWRNSAVTPTQRVEIPACPAGGGATWLAFPGGFWVDRPACVRLTVRTATGTASERVAVGTPCR